MTVLSLLNPFGWFGGSRAKLSGGSQPGQNDRRDVAVTPHLALSLSAYWACVKLIGQTVGTLPLVTYLRGASDSRTPAPDHPLWDLFHDQPNAVQSAVEFWEGIAACLAIWGMAYAEKGVIDGRLVSLEPLKPHFMQTLRSTTGQWFCRYSEPGFARDYQLEELLIVRGFGLGEVVALTPIQFHATTVRTGLAAQQAAASNFDNGMRASGWFKYKGATGYLQPDQRQQVEQLLIAPMQGAGNTGKAGVLPADFDWVATSMNAVDLQMIEVLRFSIEDVCRSFGVPPIMVGHAAQGQTMWGSGVEQIVQGFMTTGLRPVLHRIEQAIARDCLGRTLRRSVGVAFDTDELLRPDSKARALIDSQLANAGILSREEIRTSRNLSPRPAIGTLTVQSALLPIDMLGKVAKLPADKPVEAGADLEEEAGAEDGGGQKSRRPFDESKAFDEGDHPRDASGRFTVGGELAAMADRAIGDVMHEGRVAFGHADGARFSGAAGLDVHGWTLGLTAQFARHIHNRHGPGSVDRNPIRPDDYRHLPVIAAFGRVTRGGLTKHQDMQTVIVKHTVEGTHYRAVFAVRRGRKALTLHSFTKEKR